MEKLLLLNRHLNDLYSNSPIVPSGCIDVLESQIFCVAALNMRDLLESIDTIFISDKESDFDKTLKQIDLVATSGSNFKLKFHIE